MIFVYNYIKYIMIWGKYTLKKLIGNLLCIITAVIMVVSLCVIPASAATIKLNKTSLDLPIGYVFTLKVSGASSVNWSSKDSSIAKIKSTKGNTAKISGLKTGTTYIYAKVGNKTLKCKVDVKKSFISISNSSVNLSKGGSQTVAITVKGSKDIKLSNSNKNVCSAKWGNWDGDTIKLTIKANQAGNAQIKVYTKDYSKSTAKTININVGSQVDNDETEALVFVDEDGNMYFIGFVEWDAYDDTTQDNGQETAAEDNASMTERVVELVNQERAAVGVSPLVSDPELNKAAALRAQEIVQKFDHTRPNGTDCFTALNEAGISYMTAGENIAAGQSSAKGVMNSWMNSSGHKANILNSNYTKIGVGLCKTNSGYGYYWVQMFTG